MWHVAVLLVGASSVKYCHTTDMTLVLLNLGLSLVSTVSTGSGSDAVRLSRDPFFLVSLKQQAAAQRHCFRSAKKNCARANGANQ